MRLFRWAADTVPDVAELTKALRESDPVFASLDQAEVAAVVATTIDNLRMRHRYVPDVRFGGDVLFFTATRSRMAQVGAAVWAPYVTGRIDEFRIDCEHISMTETGPLQVIGKVLAGKLQRPWTKCLVRGVSGRRSSAAPWRTRPRR